MSTLAEFVAGLRESGLAALEAEVELAPGELADELRALDLAMREEFPGDAPAFDPAAAGWAAEIVHRTCVAIGNRAVPAEEALRWLGRPSPDPRNPAVIYSVDLLLRHLPELHALARRMSAGDPVVPALLQLGANWPLSSVGLPGVVLSNPSAALEPIAVHRGLRLHYADRVLARGDASRLGQDVRIDDTLRAALGHYPGLAPSLAKALELPSSGEIEERKSANCASSSP